jgi:short chain dehydrogenase
VPRLKRLTVRSCFSRGAGTPKCAIVRGQRPITARLSGEFECFVKATAFAGQHRSRAIKVVLGPDGTLCVRPRPAIARPGARHRGTGTGCEPRCVRLMLIARNEQALQALAWELSGKGANVEHMVADISDSDRLQMVADRTIARFGGFDTWINNAGFSTYGRCLEVPVSQLKPLLGPGAWLVDRREKVVDHPSLYERQVPRSALPIAMLWH